MRKAQIALAFVLSLAACKHAPTGVEGSTSDTAMSADGGTSMSTPASADAGASTMSSAADAGTSMTMPAADAGTAGAPAGATTAADAAKTAAANGSAAATSSGSSMTSSADAGASGASAAAAAPLTDAQIAGITAAAHQSEIDAAKLARKHSRNAKVRAFAAKMIKDHTGAMKEETALAKKAGLTPADSDTSAKIKSMSADGAAKLEPLKGKDFDKAYVSAQVDAHQMVLDSIDNTLLPAAQSAELKAQLTKERPVVAAHLEHARKLAADLGAM
jgi:putative membrane protein